MLTPRVPGPASEAFARTRKHTVAKPGQGRPAAPVFAHTLGTERAECVPSHALCRRRGEAAAKGMISS